MKLNQLKRICLLSLLFVLSLCAGCTNEFYLSEKEAVAYQRVFLTDSSANLTFDNLTGRTIDIQFSNSSGTPRISSTNLLAEMRRTELANLETGPSAVSLDRLRAELEAQIDHWINGRLELYTGNNNDDVRLTQLSSVSIRFLNNPGFTYRPETQSIAFDGRVTVTINGTIEVNAVNGIVDFFLGIFGSSVNGTYPLTVVINDLQLSGEANISSPFADAGRIRFQLIPKLNGTIETMENGTSVPGAIRDGVRNLLSSNLSSRVDEIFYQKYDYFALSQMRLTQTTPSLLEVNYRPRSHWAWISPETANPLLHVVVRAADGKLYYGRRGTSGWSNFAAVPFPSPTPQAITNDPALFHSGNNQLELAAVAQNYALVYSHLRDDSWGNFQTFNPGGSSPPTGYRGKPAVVASAPGQVEIIVADGNGNLRHLRRVNGIWLAPALVPLSAYVSFCPAPYRDPVALHVGNKIVVIFVDAQKRPRAIAFDLETSLWGQATSLGDRTISYAPAAAVSGDGRIDVVYVASTGAGATYHRTLDVTTNNFVTGIANTGITSGPEANLGGTLNATPALVASGYKQLELIGRGSDNKIRHNHFVNALAPFTIDGQVVNPGWQGWTGPYVDNVSQSPATTEGQVTDFAAVATRTGKTELVTQAYSFTKLHLFYNNFESARHSLAPWKTVHWRGYENVNTQTFAGRPAIASVDRNFAMTFVSRGPGSGPTTSYTQMADYNAADFVSSVDPIVRTSANPIDPIILSSGNGFVDRIVMGKDNKLHHDRSFNNGAGTPYTPTVPSGVTLTRTAAVSYGNGLIELVALGNNGRLYHWRFRNSAWSNPTALGNSIVSEPALLHVGAGQLELLAVDADYRLLRWRFTNNAWTGSTVISGDFRISNQMFGQTSVSSWGDGTVDVVVVNADTRALYQRRIGPGDETCTGFGCPAPRVFNLIGGKVYDTPVLTAFSPSKLNVLTMGQSLSWYSSWSGLQTFQPIVFPPLRDPLLAWSNFTYMGGTEMVISNAAHTGRNNFAAIAIHLDGRVYINRYTDGRWTGFQPIIGQTSSMVLTLPVILPSLATHGG